MVSEWAKYSEDEWLLKLKEQKTININISGISGSGKSIIAAYLSELFKIGNFNVNLDDDSTFSKTLDMSIIDSMSNNTNININTTQSKRNKL